MGEEQVLITLPYYTRWEYTSEFRSPKKGEWYLNQELYPRIRSTDRGGMAHHIMRERSKPEE